MPGTARTKILILKWPPAGAFSLLHIYLLDVFISKRFPFWPLLYYTKQASQPLPVSSLKINSILLTTLAGFLCNSLFSSDTGHQNCTHWFRRDQFRSLLSSIHAPSWEQPLPKHTHSLSASHQSSCRSPIPHLLSSSPPNILSQKSSLWFLIGIHSLLQLHLMLFVCLNFSWSAGEAL